MPTSFLSASQRAAWQRDGCLVLPGFASPDSIAALAARAHAIVEAFEPPQHMAVFSSRDRAALSQQALVESAGEVHCFFEEEALGADGRLVVPKAQAINKIGHALHDREPVFDRFSRDPRLAALAADLGFAEPRLMQSMLIFKQPRIGGEVVWHQDASFLITEPAKAPGRSQALALPSGDGPPNDGPGGPCGVVGFWFALEDATRDNGCLWVAPGAHRGPLRERYERQAEGHFKTRPLDATPWPGGAAARALEVSAGTLVVFDGMLPHASAPNRSERSRLAYTLHVVEGGAAWSPLNWLQRRADDPARGFV